MAQFGRYEILEELGQGAMGAVYKARDPMMDRVVAVKTILATALLGPQAAEYRERFFREARAAGRLSHPAIVTVYDVAEQEGTPFLVMEFVSGRTLESVLEAGERFPAERVLEFGQQLADALDYAHKNGVIHRDIKPANILVTEDGRPKITDFGVAKLTTAQVTATGQLLGTPAFMAPEQFTGAPIDSRSDLFALGVILYWLATGDKPFTGETLTAVSYKIVHTDPIPPRKLNPAVSRDLENVILKCMEKDPAERYQSGDDIARDLRSLRHGGRPATPFPERHPSEAERTVLADTPLADTTPGAPDTAETVAVIMPRERRPGKSSSGIRDAAPASPPAPVPPPQPSQSPARATQRPAALPALEPEKESRKLWLSAVVVLLIALAMGAVIIKRNRQPGPANPPTEALAPSQPAAPGSTGVEQQAKATAELAKQAEEPKKSAAALEAKAVSRAEKPHVTAAPHGMKLEIDASERSNVVLQPDGEPPAVYQLIPGNTVTTQAQNEMKLITSNAGAIRLKLNGKMLPPIGAQGESKTLRLTPAGIDAEWGADEAKRFAQSLRSLKGQPGQGFGAGGIPGQPNPLEIDKTVKRAMRTGFAQLHIETKGVPAALDLVVSVDGDAVLRREAATSSGMAPLSEDRFIRPGTHTIEVYLGKAAMRMGATKSVDGEFAAGQRRVLHIELNREAGVGKPGRERFQSRFSVVLE